MARSTEMLLSFLASCAGNWWRRPGKFEFLWFCSINVVVQRFNSVLSHSHDGFYRAMHFSATRGIAIACRLSVRPCVCLSVTLVNCDHIGRKSSKIISPSVSLACSLFATQTSRVYSSDG